MDDSQSPPDGENGADNRADNRKGDAAGHTGFRLSDAEQVAATRRDMFGDGSLLDALAASPSRRGDEEPGPPSDAARPAADHAGTLRGTGSLAAPGIGVTAEAEAASMAVEPAPDGDSTAEESGESGLASDEPVAAPAEQLQVSAIFEGLGSPSQGDDASPQEAAQEDVSAENAQDERAPSDPTAAGLGVPLFSEPFPAPGSSDWPPPAPPDGEDSPKSEPLEAPVSPEPAAFAEAAAWPPTAGAETYGDEPAAPGEAEREDEHAPSYEAFAWPPFPEPPGSQVNADAPPLEPPSLVTGASDPASDSPFPPPPAWPPFPGAPGSDEGSTVPEPAGLPPYIELPAHPEEPAGNTPRAAPFTEPPPPFPKPAMPPFVTAAGTEQREPPRPQGFAAAPGPETAAPKVEATAKIAAEANATAQALDNLQRLLNKTMASAAPQPAAHSHTHAYRPEPHSASFEPPHDDPYAHETPMLPLPMPPSERAGGKNVYLLGFLTGLVLSVMAGAALYFLINTS